MSVLGRILYKVTIIVAVLIAVNRIAVAQTPETIDSLKRLSDNAPDTTKVKLFNEIAWQSRFQWPLLAIQYSKKAAGLASKLGDNEELCKAYNFNGLAQRNLGNYREALAYYRKSIYTCRTLGSREEEGYGYNNIANVYCLMHNYDSAYVFANEALEFGNKIKNDDVLAYAYHYKGTILAALGDTAKAINNIREAFEIRRNGNFSMFRAMHPLKDMAALYTEQGKFEEAKTLYYSYLNECSNLEESLNKAISSTIWVSLAKLYLKSKMIDSAYYCATTGLRLTKESSANDKLPEAYNTLKLILIAQGDYKRAAFCSKEQMKSNDSIYQADLASKINNIQVTADYFQNEMEIERLDNIRHNNFIVMCILLALGIMAAILVFVLYIDRKKTKRLNSQLKIQQKQIRDSIEYAKKIQLAVLPEDNAFGTSFSEKFVYHKPMQIVSGDFRWRYEDEDFEIIAVADCTGHGVAGASMSILATSALVEIASSGTRSASEILEKLRSAIKTLLHQSDVEMAQKDGLDIALVVINKKTMEMEYSGAFVPMFYIHNNVMTKFKPAKNPIGFYVKEKPFSSEKVKLQKDDCIYLATDGFSSQFGGRSNSKMGNTEYKDLIMRIHNLPMTEQIKKIDQFLADWKGSYPQTDDILIVGLRY